MNFKIRTGFLGCLLLLSSGVNAMEQFRNSIKLAKASFPLVNIPTINASVWLNKLPTLSGFSTTLTDIYQQYPMQVKVGATIVGSASAAGFLYYVWNKNRKKVSIVEQPVLVEQPALDLFREGLKREDLRREEYTKNYLALKQIHAQKALDLPILWKNTLADQKIRAVSSNSTTPLSDLKADQQNPTGITVSSTGSTLTFDNGNLDQDAAIRAAIEQSKRDAKGKGMSDSELAIKLKTELEQLQNKGLVAERALDESSNGITNVSLLESPGLVISRLSAASSFESSSSSSGSSTPRIISSGDDSSPLGSPVAERDSFEPLSMSFTEVQLSQIKQLVTDENRLDEYVQNKLGQGFFYREEISKGNAILYDLLFGKQLTLQDANAVNQEQYLKNIIAVVWSLFSYSVEKDEGFKEGTILVKDSNDSLYNYLQGYVKKVNPESWDTVAGITGSENPFAYTRKTTHFNNATAFGIDMRPNYNGHAQGILPGFMTHFFFMKLENGYLALRMEEHGITRGGDLLWHGLGVVKSFGRRYLPSVFGTNDGEDCRKERVPVYFADMLADGILAEEAEEVYGSNVGNVSRLREVKTIADFWNVFATSFDISLGNYKKEYLEILKQLDSMHDNICARYGREVILTERDLYSLAYTNLTVSNPEAGATLKKVGALVTQARTLVRDYKQKCLQRKPEEQPVAWIGQEVQRLVQSWPHEQQYHDLLKVCAEKVRDIIIDYKKDLDILARLKAPPHDIVLLKFFNPEFKMLKAPKSEDPFNVKIDTTILLSGNRTQQQLPIVKSENSAVISPVAVQASSTSSSLPSSSQPNYNDVSGLVRIHRQDPDAARKKLEKEAKQQHACVALARKMEHERIERQKAEREAAERERIAQEEKLKQEHLSMRQEKIALFVERVEGIMQEFKLASENLVVSSMDQGIANLVRAKYLTSEYQSVWDGCWLSSSGSFDRILEEQCIDNAIRTLKNAVYATVASKKISLEDFKRCKDRIKQAFMDLLKK